MEPMKSWQQMRVCCFGCDEVFWRGRAAPLCRCSCLRWCCSALRRSCLSANRTAFRPTTSSTLSIRCIDTLTASHLYDERHLSRLYTWKAAVPSTPALFSWLQLIWHSSVMWLHALTRGFRPRDPGNSLGWVQQWLSPQYFGLLVYYFHYLQLLIFSTFTNFN